MAMVLRGVQAEAYDRTYSTGVLVARVARYFRPYAGPIGMVALCLTLFSLVNVAVPIAIAHGIHQLAKASQLSQILLLTAAVLNSSILVWVFNLLRQYHTTRVVANVVAQLRNDAFSTVIARDMSFYDEFS